MTAMLEVEIHFFKLNILQNNNKMSQAFIIDRVMYRELELKKNSEVRISSLND